MISSEHVKVHMTGEWPWVYPVAQNENSLIGVVSNQLVCTSLHGYVENDVVLFHWMDGAWEAQKKVGHIEHTQTEAGTWGTMKVSPMPEDPERFMKGLPKAISEALADLSRSLQ